jgi:hypothetical protein
VRLGHYKITSHGDQGCGNKNDTKLYKLSESVFLFASRNSERRRITAEDTAEDRTRSDCF